MVVFEWIRSFAFAHPFIGAVVGAAMALGVYAAVEKYCKGKHWLSAAAARLAGAALMFWPTYIMVRSMLSYDGYLYMGVGQLIAIGVCFMMLLYVCNFYFIFVPHRDDEQP
jgi:predicted acyltransferase